jgi:DNA-binding NarL/FixJ family response regulator
VAHRVLVVEDHPIFRDGLVQCLQAEPDFTVVGTSDGTAFDAARSGSPPSWC